MTADAPAALGLAGFNALPRAEAEQVLLSCCASTRWAAQVAAGRPYPDVDGVLDRAGAALKGLSEQDVDEALDGHPRIGSATASAQSAWSGGEQAGALSAADGVRALLQEGNRAYEQRFGHVYLVCATGRSGQQLLEVLTARLANDPVVERVVLREELGRINALRLRQVLGS